MRNFAADFDVPLFDWYAELQAFQWPEHGARPLPPGVNFGNRSLAFNDPAGGWDFMADDLCHQRDCVSEYLMDKLFQYARVACAET
jgi:hypothetical protein